MPDAPANNPSALPLLNGLELLGRPFDDTGSVLTNGEDGSIHITFAVSPASVTEDGTANLIYTFSRTGFTNSALTVNYTMGGTADASDSTGATPRAGKTITFAAGSATVTLTIDPTLDNTMELDEAVALTLGAGTDYSIGTTGTVTNAITKNDIQASGYVISSPIRPACPGRTNGEHQNDGAFAALKADGSVVTWGGIFSGGNSSAVASQLRSGVTQIFSTDRSFAALKADGSVVTWGGGVGNSSAVASQLRSGVTQIFSTNSAFAALKADGSVVTWGALGGDSSAVASQLRSGVTQIFSNPSAFAALKADGSVVTWGIYEGADSSDVASQLRSGVTQIFATNSAFAALKADGSVVTWGNDYWGGNSSAVASQLRSGVSQIFSTIGSFAALKADGSVVTWGASGGGNSSAVASQLRSGVTQIFSTNGSFAALKADGSVVTWGGGSGGNSSAVASQLRSGVTQIFSTQSAFAALKANGSVVTWGDWDYGGDSSAVASQLTSGVIRIFSTGYAFAALKADGSVVTWPGDSFSNSGGNSSAVASQLRSGVTQIFSTQSAFAALKADGSVVTWGDRDNGGNSSAVASQLTSGVVGFANPFTNDWLVSDSPATIRLAVSPAQVTEDGSSNLIYTFSRTGDTTNSLTVNYAVTGTADSSDYTGATPGAGKTITFAANSATAALAIDPTADTTIEPDETVALTLAAGIGYTIGTTTPVTGTLSNDDLPVITLAVSPASVTEDGTANLIYTFSRTGFTNSPLTVNYTVGGTATLGTDYTGIAATPATKTVTFAANSATATLAIDPTADTTIEPDETVALTLAAGIGYTIGTTTPVTGTLSNDDLPVITLAVSPASVTEDGTANLIYTFSRTGFTNSPLTVNYTVGGTATLGTDYTGIAATPATKTVTFAANSATATLAIDPTADTTIEPDETVALTLAAGIGYTIGTTTPVTGTLSNDDLPVITLAVSPASVTEDGTANLIYTFSRTGFTNSPLTVNYTVGGTATLGTDYTGIAATPATKTVTFAANSATATLAIDPTADTTIEPDETVALTLAAGIGYTIGTTTPVTGTLSNDDLPVITLAVSPASVTEDGTANLIYTFSRTGFTNSPLTVNYTVGGTATLGTDYTGIAATPATKTVTFAANSATATLAIDPTADTTIEPDETVALTLAAGIGYTIGTTTPVTGTLSNDDFSLPTPANLQYDWQTATPLGGLPALLKANLTLTSPRPTEPTLSVTALRVDLWAPGISLTGTPRATDWSNGVRETISQTTRQFISASRSAGLPVVAAINAAPFDLISQFQFQAVPTNLRGFVASEGQLVSDTDSNADTFKSTFLFDRITGARIENIAATNAPASASLKVATSGFGIVLNNGQVTVENTLQNARSGLGLSADRRYLTLLAVDRRPNTSQPGAWHGATDFDAGQILRGFGATKGMLLDGGGSTQLAWWNGGLPQPELLSNPLFERFVGSSLGVTYQQPVG